MPPRRCAQHTADPYPVGKPADYAGGTACLLGVVDACSAARRAVPAGAARCGRWPLSMSLADWLASLMTAASGARCDRVCGWNARRLVRLRCGGARTAHYHAACCHGDDNGGTALAAAAGRIRAGRVRSRMAQRFHVRAAGMVACCTGATFHAGPRVMAVHGRRHASSALPRVSGSVSAARISTPYAAAAKMPMAWPSDICWLTWPIRKGKNAPIARPTL